YRETPASFSAGPNLSPRSGGLTGSSMITLSMCTSDICAESSETRLLEGATFVPSGVSATGWVSDSELSRLQSHLRAEIMAAPIVRPVELWHQAAHRIERGRCWLRGQRVVCRLSSSSGNLPRSPGPGRHRS